MTSDSKCTCNYRITQLHNYVEGKKHFSRLFKSRCIFWWTIIFCMHSYKIQIFCYTILLMFHQCTFLFFRSRVITVHDICCLVIAQKTQRFQNWTKMAAQWHLKVTLSPPWHYKGTAFEICYKPSLLHLYLCNLFILHLYIIN